MSDLSNISENTPPKNGSAPASFSDISSDVEKIIIEETPHSKSDDESSESTSKPLDDEDIMEKILYEANRSSVRSQQMLDLLREINSSIMRMEAAWAPTMSAGRPGPLQRFFDGI